jgi:uncharacterized delta-60 repeat protein
VESILVQPDGKIFIGGMFTKYDTTSLPEGVARFLPANGGAIAIISEPFFFGGFFPILANEGAGNASIPFKRQIANDGRTVAKLTLNFSGTASAADFSIPAVGALDTTFNYGAGKGANGIVNAVALQPDGKMLIGGNFTAYNGDASASDRILRLNLNGTLDTTFNYGAGLGADGVVKAIVVQPGGKILIGGDFTSYNSDADASDRILRLNTDGTVDAIFNYGPGLGANGIVNAISLQPNGNVLIGGDFTTYNSDGNASDRILRLLPDGKLDKAFFNYGAGLGINGPVNAIGLQTDEKILVGGDFTSYNSDANASDNVLRLSPTGALDTTFNYGPGLGANNTVNDLELLSNGKILIGGIFRVTTATYRQATASCASRPTARSTTLLTTATTWARMAQFWRWRCSPMTRYSSAAASRFITAIMTRAIEFYGSALMGRSILLSTTGPVWAQITL